MHRLDAELRELAAELLATALARLGAEAPELGRSAPPAEVAARAGTTITEHGLGGREALERWRDALAPFNTAIDHPRYLAFIPGAPTVASALFDLLVSTSGAYAGTWLEGAGAVHAENEALRWIADLAGFPPGAGGAFVQGGTNGNLSALHAARQRARHERGDPAARLRVAASDDAHSSVRMAARVMDVEVLTVPSDEHGRLTGAALRTALRDSEDVFAVVATAGTTNLGLLDDLAGVADACAEHGAWLHVDGAYGAGALAAPSARARFAGIERADSLIVDPHKWLFSPFDTCALLYREPGWARAAHRQSASYLDALYRDDERSGDEPAGRGRMWNPSDYAVHLTRRARGLPLWFSLAVHGTRAYADAVERTLAVTRAGAEEIRRRADLELLVEPELSVLVFRRRGWGDEDYHRWADGLRADGTAFVVPTTVGGETVARLALVNPRTTADDVRAVLDTM
jgi:glutamate/tyrosine decarboxylase-like PLP-dependent enzyme